MDDVIEKFHSFQYWQFEFCVCVSVSSENKNDRFSIESLDATPSSDSSKKKKSIEYYENFIIFVGHVIINFNAINQSRTTAIENNI